MAAIPVVIKATKTNLKVLLPEMLDMLVQLKVKGKGNVHL